MPDPTGGIATAAIVGTVGSIGSSIIGASAADDAADAQAAAADASIAEQRRQYDEARRVLQPFVDVGEPAVNAMMSMVGLGSPGEQQAMIDSIQRSPVYDQMINVGEEGILQNASATGGLRGGNTQGALSELRPAVLSDLYQQQFNQLGSLAQIGQSSAAMTGTNAINTGQGVSNALIQQGQARAGGELAKGQAWNNGFGAVSEGIGFGLGAYGANQGWKGF